MYIDFSGIYDLIPLCRDPALTSMLASCPFRLTVIKAESHPLFHNDVQQMHALFQSVKYISCGAITSRSVDGKEDLMRIIRDSLLKSHMEEEPPESYLLYGYTMDHLTEHVLYSLSNNTGFSLVSSSSLHSYSNPSFSVAYPLSALTAREIVIYCHFKQIPFLTQFTFLSNKGDSVYRLARSMVESLQDECDSTLHIVTETVGKLQSCPEVCPEKKQVCRFCGESHCVELFP